MIKIQKKKFNLEKEINQIKKYHNSVGAVSTFIGYVRNINDKKAVKLIELQVYKDMAFSELEKICVKAKKKMGITRLFSNP